MGWWLLLHSRIQTPAWHALLWLFFATLFWAVQVSASLLESKSMLLLGLIAGPSLVRVQSTSIFSGALLRWRGWCVLSPLARNFQSWWATRSCRCSSDTCVGRRRWLITSGHFPCFASIVQHGHHIWLENSCLGCMRELSGSPDFPESVERTTGFLDASFDFFGSSSCFIHYGSKVDTTYLLHT